MLKLYLNLNSFHVKILKNSPHYFSTTNMVKNTVNVPVLTNKNKHKIVVIKQKLGTKVSLTEVKENVTFNKVRAKKNNYFIYYYYKRFPINFRLYPFIYKYWVYRKFIKKWHKKSKQIWRIKLYRINYKLLHLKQYFSYLTTEFSFLNRKLERLKIYFIKVPKNKLKHKKRLNCWTRLLALNSVKNNLIYNKYKKKLNKFTKNYLNTSYSMVHNNKRKVFKITGFTNHLHAWQRHVAYMKYIKFYKTQQVYYNFRYCIRPKGHRYLKRLKWIYKKRLKKSVETSFMKTYRTNLYVKKRKPYRLHKRTRAYKYKHFSYYWLRYFFKRFKQMYIDTNNTIQINYNDIKKYLLCWLYKVKNYKVLSLHSLNPARGFLLYKTNKLHNDMKDYGLFSSYAKLTFLHERNELDDLFKSMVNKKRYLYRNFYWRFYKSALERRKAQILKRYYHFTWGLRPYIFVHKKQKVFYNWADRHIFKRFPLYRYKYSLFFKFPRFADYRRLFKNQLREQHVFRYLYRLKLGQLIKAFRKSTYKTKRIFELMFLKYFELRLDTVVYRLNFAWSLKHARQLVLRGLFLVNNKIIDNHKYHVGLGDVIMPIKRLRMQPLSKKYLNYIDYGATMSWTRLFYRQIQSDQYPTHLLLNERIPAGMLVNKFNPNTLRFNKPFSVQFLTLSLLKYN